MLDGLRVTQEVIEISDDEGVEKKDEVGSRKRKRWLMTHEVG